MQYPTVQCLSRDACGELRKGILPPCLTTACVSVMVNVGLQDSAAGGSWGYAARMVLHGLRATARKAGM